MGKKNPWDSPHMFRFSLIFAVIALLGACATPEPRFGPDGKPLPQIYLIKSSKTAEIQFRMLDSVNALRQASSAAPLRLNSELTAAAKTHAQDMSVQNRPWHFGSDGSSPLDRVARVGYTGRLIGENISETFETEIETLSAWMEVPETREVLLDPRAGDLGFAWHQEPSGKIWWVLVTGQPGV